MSWRRKKFDEAIVHIGFPKTATTSIQKALNDNRDRLEQSYGSLYPFDRPRPDHVRVFFLAFGPDELEGQEIVSLGLASPSERERSARQYLGELGTAMRRSRAKRLILSAQILAAFRTKQVLAFKEFDLLTVPFELVFRIYGEPGDYPELSTELVVLGNAGWVVTGTAVIWLRYRRLAAA